MFAAGARVVQRRCQGPMNAGFGIFDILHADEAAIDGDGVGLP